jgi:hypothetical protein
MVQEQLKENYTEFVEGFPLTGEEVKNSKNKKFEIVGHPEYHVYEYQGKAKRILKMQIIFNGEEITYSPNKDSQRKIMNKCGRRLENWRGFKGEFETVLQVIGTDKKEVIYIK